MKNNFLLFLITAFLLISCGGMNKSMMKSTSQTTANKQTQVPNETVKSEETPIPEVKEKLVSIKNTPDDPNTYFVIIGSFRNLNNAKTHQEQIASDGFTSVIVKNEEGLYRVSVKSTDDITLARTEIHRIRNQFNKYGDTWLLIRIK